MNTTVAQHPPAVEIGSYILHCLPQALGPIEQQLQQLTGVDVVVADPAGKIIFVAEASHTTALADLVCQASAFTGVINVSMAFHALDVD